MDNVVEGVLAKYIEFKTFEFFRDKLYSTVSPYAKADSKNDLYKHLFLCPTEIAKERNFKLHGVLSPFVCLWRTSSLQFEPKFYGRSVLPRCFTYYDKDDKLQAVPGFLYDVKCTFNLFSSSYYKNFRDAVNQDILDLDRIRYFDYDIKELFSNCSNCTTRAELKLDGLTQQENLNGNQRSFDLSCAYSLWITIPYNRNEAYPDSLNLYLNNNLIYQTTDD